MNRPHAAGKRAQRPASGALTPQEASPVREGDLSGSGGNVSAAGAAAAVLAAGFLLTKVLRRRLGGDGDRNAPRGQHSGAHVHDCSHLGRQGVCSHFDQVLVVHTKAANSSIWLGVDCARQTASHLPAYRCMIPSRAAGRSSCIASKHSYLVAAQTAEHVEVHARCRWRCVCRQCHTAAAAHASKAARAAAGGGGGQGPGFCQARRFSCKVPSTCCMATHATVATTAIHWCTAIAAAHVARRACLIPCQHPAQRGYAPGLHCQLSIQ